MNSRLGFSRMHFLAWTVVSIVTSVLGHFFLEDSGPSTATAGTPLASAFEQTQDSDRLVVADFGADWCEWCRKMDATTWADPTVRKLVKDHALLVPIDATAQPKLVAGFQVSVYPTVIVFRDGKEIARKNGYVAPAEMCAWLKELEQ